MAKNSSLEIKETTLTSDRLKQMINCILSELCDKVWEAPTEQYIPWLKNEVGFTDEEIKELKEANCFPEPLI